jgi:serine/threonine-protein kinase
MEYIPGLTLEEVVKREGPLPFDRAVHFLRQLCGALKEAHGRGLIHGRSARARGQTAP